MGLLRSLGELIESVVGYVSNQFQVIVSDGQVASEYKVFSKRFEDSYDKIETEFKADFIQAVKIAVPIFIGEQVRSEVSSEKLKGDYYMVDPGDDSKEVYWYESVYDAIGNVIGGKIKADATVKTSKNISDSIAGLVKVLAIIAAVYGIFILIFKRK